jgi:Lectin C-type domain
LSLELHKKCIKSIPEQLFANYNKTKSVGWKYNLNYWTGGTQRSCKGQWSWCAGADSVAFQDNLTWAFNQPDNRAGADDCMHMRFPQNSSAAIVLSDRNCSDKYVIACEVTK